MSKKNTTHTVLMLSDPHVGSSYGLMPPGFIRSHGGKVELNPLQEWLHECWMAGQEWFFNHVGTNPYIFICNGDAIDGIHHASVEVSLNNIPDQVEAASMLLMPFAKRAAATYLIEGTECHTGEHEGTLGMVIGAKRNPDNNKAVWPRLELEINGSVLAVKHHFPTSMRDWTSASAFSSHQAQERLEALRDEVSPPTVICAAHRHRFGMWEDDGGLCIVTPPWQGGTRFARKVVPNPRVRPGLVVLDFSERGECVVHKIRFQPPKPKRIRL